MQKFSLPVVSKILMVRVSSLKTTLGSVFLWTLLSGAAAQPTTSSDLFISQTNDVVEFRIPAMISTRSGVVLAVCDARVDRPGDVPNNVDQVIRRSKDSGKTWDEIRTVIDFPNQEGAADPQLLQDQQTGRIFLFYVFCPGRSDVLEGPATIRRYLQTHYVYSDDDGLTWSLPVVVEHGLKKEGWHSFWPSPGRGIQLASGRLVVPVTMYDFQEMYACYLYSDDHGDHWGISDPIASGLSEAKFAQLDNGTLMINSRVATDRGKRAIITSPDEGATWSEIKYHPELIEPRCNGSFIKVSYKSKSILLFSNPADSTKRQNMTVKVSLDDGATWPISRTIYAGPSAYSCMSLLPDGDIGLLYENGGKKPYEKITLVKFSLDWLFNKE